MTVNDAHSIVKAVLSGDPDGDDVGLFDIRFADLDYNERDDLEDAIDSLKMLERSLSSKSEFDGVTYPNDPKNDTND